MSVTPVRSSGSSAAASVLRSILDEISVPMALLKEARTRRDRVLSIAYGHYAVRARYSAGSVAYGTANRPLEDADGGVKMNRQLADLREFGPDAPGSGGLGPGPLMEHLGGYVLERLRGDYPEATVNTTGKRAIKFDFHSPVDLDELGEVDPYVHFIIGLARAEGRGLWIPNRKLALGWDIADPEHHLYVMNRQSSRDLRVYRAHLIRLVKRAVKRDAAAGHLQVVCSWNISALALELIENAELSLPDALAAFLAAAASEIEWQLTPDPSPVVAPIALPGGVTNAMAAARLAEMAEYAHEAATARSEAGARNAYAKLYGPEIDAIRERSARSADRLLVTGATLAPLASRAHKPTRSDGA